MRLLLVAALAACLLVGIARDAAAAPVDELLSRLDTIERLQGSFRQQQFDDDGTVLLASSGTFRILRPGYFAWEISDPDSQLVLADPEFLWHYDRDLETVTRRPVSGEQMAPLQVLGGDDQLLRERFAVTSDGPDTFTLVPAQGDPGFRQLTLVFEDGQLAAMEIVDRLKQRLSVQFNDLDTESVLTPDDFAFQPPPDADLFFYDE
jgi:outer membrane lipoprotein carrier protein